MANDFVSPKMNNYKKNVDKVSWDKMKKRTKKIKSKYHSIIPYIFCDIRYPNCADNPNEPDFGIFLQAVIPASLLSPLFFHSDLFPLSPSCHPHLYLVKKSF